MAPTSRAPQHASAGGSRWRDSFAFDHVKVLVVGRGPIRLEAIRAFDGLGAQPTGMLLSERDSIVYDRALSPELRAVGRNERVHRVRDYGPGDGVDKAERIDRLLRIARQGGYTHLFAGYGFMAEDHEFIQAIAEAGLGFVGPSAAVVRSAGDKDAAKALARDLALSITPGVDDVLARALLAGAKRGKERALLEGLITTHRLPVAAQDLPPLALAEAVLATARERSLSLVSLEALQAEARRQVQRLLRDHPGRRLRLKHVGGGGGKGQRIISTAAQAPDAVFEVLNEVKATGPGDNWNFLIEVNIENTRHNEIQLLGNGQWCIALGGRDCSLQMHEQKLVEVSITTDDLEATAARYAQTGKRRQAAVLREDLAVLRAMEAQAEKFGAAVGLDSASTFESIVTGIRHYFMEMNTRIQVEHRVTEMVYTLRFTDSDGTGESFTINSLVEAMLWMAVHGARLPRPERIPHHPSGAEVRINTTNHALQPHAGGVVTHWSAPLPAEVRDDQGIGITNPDTGMFMPYRLAGAYDSNAALVVTHGDDRETTLAGLAEILRLTEIQGEDVQTNRPFHYGLLHWLLGWEPMAKPTTRFVADYLAAAGALAELSRDVELELAWETMARRVAAAEPAAVPLLERKTTLILRPLRRLFGDPHLMAGWLAPRPQRRWEMRRGRAVWLRNPLEVLAQLYHYLRLEEHPGVTPDEKIWPDDAALLEQGLAFYEALGERLPPAERPWPSLRARLDRTAPPKGMRAAPWAATQAAHRGHQLGLEVLALPFVVGERTGFAGLRVNERLEPVVPAAFRDPARVGDYLTALAPPPPTRSDTVAAWTGGTFYARADPETPPYVSPGDRVAPGDVLGLLEVMKMFNPIRAEFAGTVAEVLVTGDSGTIVHKGQPLFRIAPDVLPREYSEEELAQRRAEVTTDLLSGL